MARKCEHMVSSRDGKRAIYIDSKNKNNILSYITQDERHKKKFNYIVEIILNGYKNTEIYDKEDINSKCQNVTAMKFFKGQENDRIYCKEIHSSEGTKVVVTSILHEKKKSSKLSSKEKSIINKVGGYDYEL